MRRVALALPLLLLPLLAGCEEEVDPCLGLRCAGSSVSVTVGSDTPLTAVSATSSVELTCQDVSPSFGTATGTRWTCYGRPTGAGPLEVTLDLDGRVEAVTVDVTARETECCGTVAEGTATIVLGADAGA